MRVAAAVAPGSGTGAGQRQACVSAGLPDTNLSKSLDSSAPLGLSLLGEIELSLMAFKAPSAGPGAAVL